MNKERFIAISKAQIGEYVAFCGYLNVLFDVAELFDGKTLNVRFKKAVDAACEQVYNPNTNVSSPRFGISTEVRKYETWENERRVSYQRLWFTFYMCNRWVALGKDKNGVTTGTYIDGDMNLSFFADGGVTPENRICARAIRDAVVAKIKNVRETVAILIDAIDKYDYYQKVIADLRDAIGESVAEVNPKFRPQELTRFASHESLEKGCKTIIDRVCGLQK